jgi:hypothetical protein
VRRASRAAFFAWSVAGLVGCAAISGLDQLRESDCAPDCGAPASDDATGGGSDTGATADSWRPRDAPVQDADDGSERRDGTLGEDSHAPDAYVVDAPSDTTAGMETSSTSDATGDVGDGSADTGNGEGGCGPTNTVDNCGACGAKCAPASPSVSVPTCLNGTCSYSCNAGYLDCNASVPPNTDGCECQTLGSISATCCPSNACPTQHYTGFPRGPNPPGLDQTFYDCNTSINEQVAMEACYQYAGLNPTTMMTNCATNTAFGASCGNSDLVVCNFYSSTQNCVCWDYQGSAVGWAYNSGSTHSCFCPVGNSALGEVRYH